VVGVIRPAVWHDHRSSPLLSRARPGEQDGRDHRQQHVKRHQQQRCRR
jgi:hypothetical protein